jgi:hypothetical protein
MAAGLSPAIARHPAIHRLAVAIADERIVCCSDGDRIARFNNGQETVEPVLAAFDRAIAASKEPTP